MSDRTNDEKLRILQERLAQIKVKDDADLPLEPMDESAQIKQKHEIPAATSKEEKEEVIEVSSPQTETPQKEKSPTSFKWLKYFILSFLCGFGGYYAYNNIDFTNTFASDEEIEETKEFVLEYDLNIPGKKHPFLKLTFVAITASFEDEPSAKAMVNDLKEKGYKCDYFFLPEQSNSSEEVYKVFIGPYETEGEANQEVKPLKTEFEIINL